MGEPNPVPQYVPDAPPVDVDLSAELDITWFEREHRIHSGDKTEIYRYSLSNGDAVAIKVPNTSATVSPGAGKEILHEADKWALFEDNDHVVSLVDYGLTEGVHWIAMEYMDGGNLEDFFERGGIESLSHGIWIARCIAAGLDKAHYRGVAHGDIKPQNILFRTVEEKWNVPKIGDWGTSVALLESSETVADYSPRYAAPEQHLDQISKGEEKRIDVFQFGLVLFLLFTGEHPYGLTSEPAIKDDPPTPSEERPGIPKALDTLIETCLARDPEERFRDISPIYDRLDEFWDAVAQ